MSVSPTIDERELQGSASGFSFAESRRLIDDLRRPDPRIYWFDFLCSITAAHATLASLFLIPLWFADRVWMVPALVMSYLAAVVLYKRAAMFTHELVHLPKREFRGFRIAWNALCGVPFMVPSFLYYPHVDHHRRKHYGTRHDGEYLSLSHRSRWLIVGFVVQALIIPLLAIFRFLVIAPVCWLVPGFRPWAHRHASTMLVDPSYERCDASPGLMRMVVFQEICCFFAIVAFLLHGYVLFGHWYSPLFVDVYCVAVGVVVVNEVRTLGAHRWQNDGGEMTFTEQLLDSVNYPNHPWTSELWAPVGLRFHALHHLFPSLPYHNLPEAHRRLVQGLPADSPYHQTIAQSLPSELIGLWRRAGKRRQLQSDETLG